MSKTARVPEPSMEEILASIRRIIADDTSSPPARPMPRVVPGAQQDHGMVSRPSEPLPPPDPVAAEPDILELTQPVEPAPSAAFTHVRGPDVVFREEDHRQEVRAPAPPPPPTPRAASQPVPAPTAAATMEAALLSQNSSQAVTAAFNSLATTVISENSRTLEDIVKEMMRPMLKHWLDENLPGMVERIVRAEIERVARGGR
jgi:cell pole-organizing protein PopZ